MKRLASLATVALSAVIVSLAAGGTPCPYNIAYTPYGAACSQSGAPVPVLGGGSNMTTSCHAALKFNVSGFCCNVFLNQQLLIIGASAVSVPVPGGCKLLASPDVIIPLTPFVGTTLLEADLPPTPSLIGVSLYLQGVVGRFETIGFQQDFDFTDGLQLSITP